LLTFFVPVNWYWSSVKITDFDILESNFAANGENRTISFRYETTEGAGVRIFPRPETNGQLTSGYSACGSGIYTGSGTGSCGFTIEGGNQRVDHIRFRVTDPDQNRELLVLRQPTDLFFGDLLIENLVTCPPSPARLLPGELVNGFFDYTNNTGESARMFFRPATAGSLSPGYAASGSPSYPAGSSNGSAFFTINQSDVLVDQIHFRTTNDNQSVDLGTFHYDVHYLYGEGMISGQRELETPQHLSWQLSPNPARAWTTMHIQSEQHTQVQVRLFDLRGQLLWQGPSLSLAAGQNVQHTIPLASLNLPNGMYLLQVRGAQFQDTKKLLIQR
ncbi:MAG: T9SS C-terminal target domain-containing protein, partial [Bacteroidetes bacterium]